MTKISSGLVAMDRFCDYVPVVSTVNNLVDLFLKAVVIPCMSRQSVNHSHYFSHIRYKSAARCVLLSIPFLNVCVKFFDACCNLRKPNQSLTKVLRDAKKVIDSAKTEVTNLDETKNSVDVSNSEDDESVSSSDSEDDENLSETNNSHAQSAQHHTALFYAALRQK